MPLYKHWPRIRKIGERAPFLMLHLATLDLKRRDSITRRTIEAFPECFNGKPSRATIPLTILRRKRLEIMEDDDPPELARFFQLPDIAFATDEDFIREHPDSDLQLAPPDLDKCVEFGDVIAWRGRSLFTYYVDGQQNRFIPAACIDRKA